MSPMLGPVGAIGAVVAGLLPALQPQVPLKSLLPPVVLPALGTPEDGCKKITRIRGHMSFGRHTRLRGEYPLKGLTL
jgi:hypothetical protein